MDSENRLLAVLEEIATELDRRARKQRDLNATASPKGFIAPASFERFRAHQSDAEYVRSIASRESFEQSKDDDMWPLRARVWTRTSVEPHEKVLEIEGVIGETEMTIRHTQSLAVADEDVPGLPEFYSEQSNGEQRG